MQAPDVGHGDDAIRVPRFLDQFPAALGGNRERLLDQHVASRGYGLSRHRHVQRGRGAQNDEVGFLPQCLLQGWNQTHPVAIRHFPSTDLAGLAQTEIRPSGLLKAPEMPLTNAAAADDEGGMSH